MSIRNRHIQLQARERRAAKRRQVDAVEQAAIQKMVDAVFPDKTPFTMEDLGSLALIILVAGALTLLVSRFFTS
jgi:hypothetical protein